MFRFGISPSAKVIRHRMRPVRERFARCFPAAVLSGFLILCATAQEPSDPGTDPLDQFRSRYEEVAEGFLQPIQQLKAGYVERLKVELETAKAAGVLEHVQAVMSEIDWVEDRGKMPAETEMASILKFRERYLSALRERERECLEKLEGLAKRSANALDAMQRDYTREGKIERAEATRDFSEMIWEGVETLRLALESPGLPGLQAGETVLWSLGQADFKTALGGEARESGGSWTLTAPPEQRGHIRSPMSIAPPFRISTLVASESGDLRFYYGAETDLEFVLFNWTRNPTVLRLTDPSGAQGIQSVPDRGLLEPGRSYLIELVVRERKIEVFVDGESRGSRTTDLKRYREPVGIGPFGSVTAPGRLIMEHFVVVQLKE